MNQFVMDEPSRFDPLRSSVCTRLFVISFMKNPTERKLQKVIKNYNSVTMRRRQVYLRLLRNNGLVSTLVPNWNWGFGYAMASIHILKIMITNERLTARDLYMHRDATGRNGFFVNMFFSGEFEEDATKSTKLIVELLDLIRLYALALHDTTPLSDDEFRKLVNLVCHIMAYRSTYPTRRRYCKHPFKNIGSQFNVALAVNNVEVSASFQGVMGAFETLFHGDLVEYDETALILTTLFSNWRSAVINYAKKYKNTPGPCNVYERVLIILRLRAGRNEGIVGHRRLHVLQTCEMQLLSYKNALSLEELRKGIWRHWLLKYQAEEIFQTKLKHGHMSRDRSTHLLSATYPNTRFCVRAQKSRELSYCDYPRTRSCSKVRLEILITSKMEQIMSNVLQFLGPNYKYCRNPLRMRLEKSADSLHYFRSYLRHAVSLHVEVQEIKRLVKRRRLMR